jgi:hypothetical protein
MVRNSRRRTIKQAQDKGWRDEWVAFSKAIREGGEPPIPYEQLVGVTKTTIAAVESLHNNGQKILIDGV